MCTTIIRLLLAAVLMAAGGQMMPAKAGETYQTCKGFIDSLPTTISSQGVWCLRKDLSTAITSGYAITIATNNVTIVCNDFKIGGLAGGPGSSATGIYSDGRQNAVIRNCNIRGFYHGVLIVGGAGHLVEDNRLDNNLYSGIWLFDTDNSMVRRNRVYDTGGYLGGGGTFGIAADADIVDNTVSGMFTDTAGANTIGIRSGGRGSQIGRNRVAGLIPGADGGSAIGILAQGGHQTIDGNRVIAGVPEAVGRGIQAVSESNSFCTGNTVAGWASPAANSIFDCLDSGGNAWD